MGAGKKVWGYYPAGDVWLPLRCNAVGQLEVDLSNVDLGDLGDVNLVGLANQNLIWWNAAAGEWQNVAPGAVAGAINLNDLADVNVPAPAGNDLFYWDAVAAQWQSRTIPANLDTLLTVRGDILRRGAVTSERYAIGAAGTALISNGIDPAWGALTFIGLGDTPAAYPAIVGQSPVVNAALNALEWDCRASVTCAAMTVYVDGDAVGAGDGTSWADGFTTIQAAWDSLPTVIAHAVTIRCRAATNPYREIVTVSERYVLATVTIEGEYYWEGDCAANVGGAGEITDVGAFADVQVGDQVFVLDLNGAGGRAQAYEFGTVDDITNIPNRIGTDLTVVPTLGWDYVIVRTEISGSDDGTYGGQVRDYCIVGTSVDNVTIRGFYFTFADRYYVWLTNCRNWNGYYWITRYCDSGLSLATYSRIYCDYIGYNGGSVGIYLRSQSSVDMRHYAIYSSVDGVNAYQLCNAMLLWGVIDDPTDGIHADGVSWASIYYSTILNTVTNGLRGVHNSSIYASSTTNNAVNPEVPAGTVEGAFID